VASSLDSAYAELLQALPTQKSLNVDETGHKENGQGMWTWCFRAPLFTLFGIDPSRGSEVLVKMLGLEFDGVLGCDYFSAYRKYMKDCGVLVQFCLAHLIRDVKFLVEHPNRANRDYGQMLLEHLRQLFGVIHRRALYASAASFRQVLATVRNNLVADAILNMPNTREAGNLANRFAEHMDSYFRFITTPHVEPTNNLAEQAIRFGQAIEGLRNDYLEDPCYGLNGMRRTRQMVHPDHVVRSSQPGLVLTAIFNARFGGRKLQSPCMVTHCRCRGRWSSQPAGPEIMPLMWSYTQKSVASARPQALTTRSGLARSRA